MRRQLLRSFRSSCVLGVVAAVAVSMAGVPAASAGAVRSPTAAAAASVAAAPAVTSVAGGVVSVTPARVADSRVNQQITGAVPASGTVTVQVTGQGGVPATNVAAVVLNVTVVSPQGAGFITVWPFGISQTNTSNLNFLAGQTIPNTVIVPVGIDGKIQLFNGSGGTAHLLVDITGYTLAGVPTDPGAVAPVTPARIADSRTNQQITGAIPASGTATVQVTGRGGVPTTNVAAVVLNVTAVSPQSAGFITVWPFGIPRTNTSNLNFQAGQTIPNTVIVPVGTGGKIQLFNGSGGTAHLLVDVTGYTLAAVTPVVGGSAVAWGGGDYSQLGNGSTQHSTVPVAVSGMTDAIGITSGIRTAYALRADGTVWAWGSSFDGQLGNSCLPTPCARSTPVRVAGLSNITAIAGGSMTGYALRDDETVWAWGRGDRGALGSGDNANTAVPVQVSDLGNVVAIAGGAANGYAVRGDGTVWSWGVGSLGALGNNSTADSSVPVQVSGLTNVIGVAGGELTGYALRNDGTVWAWGQGAYGRLGNGGTADSSVPVQVSGLTDVIAVAGGDFNGYALRGDGTVRSWGYGSSGALGDGGPAFSEPVSATTPVQVSGLTDVIAIEAGQLTGYALRNDGTVRSWGHGYLGALGNGGTTDSYAPAQVSGLSNVTAIAGGFYNGYAVHR